MKILYNIDILKCKKCIIILTGDVSLYNGSECVDFVHDLLGDDVDIIFSISYSNDIVDYIKIQLLLKLENDSLRNL